MTLIQISRSFRSVRFWIFFLHVWWHRGRHWHGRKFCWRERCTSRWPCCHWCLYRVHLILQFYSSWILYLFRCWKLLMSATWATLLLMIKVHVLYLEFRNFWQFALILCVMLLHNGCAVCAVNSKCAQVCVGTWRNSFAGNSLCLLVQVQVDKTKCLL